MTSFHHIHIPGLFISCMTCHLIEVKKKIAEAGFMYPFIVKPDVGMKGILFRKIDNEEQLN